MPADPAGRRTDLDRVLHEPARLGILTVLVARPQGLSFVELRRLCGLTDGNLSRHLRALQEAGCAAVDKGYVDNRPHSTCRITPDGRTRFIDHLAVLERLVREGAAAADEGESLARAGATR